MSSGYGLGPSHEALASWLPTLRTQTPLAVIGNQVLFQGKRIGECATPEQANILWDDYCQWVVLLAEQGKPDPATSEEVLEVLSMLLEDSDDIQFQTGMRA